MCSGAHVSIFGFECVWLLSWLRNGARDFQMYIGQQGSLNTGIGKSFLDLHLNFVFYFFIDSS